MTLSNKAYDTLKWIAQIFLPAVATLYFALAQIWGFGYGEEVVGSITAVDAFLGVLLGLAAKSYNAGDGKYDGAINVSTQTDGKKLFSLDLNEDPSTLDTRQEVLFKVNQQ